ncbi:MAG: L-seryl-tRNA(Sec) selenium transferase [Desulfovibrio sp.]|nr:L-seryl-tRNA(Sec) selenium transferase [Desulfovibrio sp.]
MNSICFRAIPSVDVCMEMLLSADGTLADVPRTCLRDAVSTYWDERRSDIRRGAISAPELLTLENNRAGLLRFVRKKLSPNFKRVLNATGVVVHTNLGRSVLSEDARKAVARAASGYCNLELDMGTGTRGSRYGLVEDMLCKLTGAEAAIVVNNNAAAVMLMLDTFCRAGEVVVSRGELVEIGGSFRMPDIMKKSGAVLREVGATNRTRLNDYREAINENTCALMRVHTSNFRIVGFHSSVDLSQLVTLAHDNGLLLIEDLGSGSLIPLHVQGLPDEPSVPSVVSAGVDLVSFSGDKVLGGPQAGIIVGRKELVAKLSSNQLTRALRCDKLCLSALEATLRQYFDPDKAMRNIPTLRCITMAPGELAGKARALARRVKAHASDACRVSIRDGVSRVGGGAFPQYDLPTKLVCLSSSTVDAMTVKMRFLKAETPLVGRIEDDTFCLDVRTLEREELPLVAHLVESVFSMTKEQG